MTRNTAFLKDMGALAIGSVALLIAGIQPLLLGALAHAERLSVSEIGLAAMVELLTLGIACGIAAARFNSNKVRSITFAAGLAHAAVNLACIPLGGLSLVAMRGLSGVLEGVMLWTAISMIMRSRSPERYTGLFVILQALMQALAAAALSVAMLPAFGLSGSFIMLAIISAMAAGLALVGHTQYQPLPKGEALAGATGLTGLAGLMSLFLFMAFSVGLWVYLEPLAVHAGMTGEAAANLIALTLVAQLAGGVAATVIGGRWSPFRTLLIGGCLNLGVAVTFAASPSQTTFVLAAMAFGFLWIFLMPFQTQFLIRIDPSRRAAMQIGTAQLLGCAFGPLVASLLVTDDSIGQTPALFAVFMLLSQLVVAGLALRHRSAASSSLMASA